MRRLHWLGWMVSLGAAACTGCGAPTDPPTEGTVAPPPDAELPPDLGPDVGPPVLPVPTFDTVRKGRTLFAGVTLGGGQAWVLSRDSRIDTNDGWLFATPDAVTLDAIDVVTGAVTASIPLHTGATAAEIATDDTTVFVHSCDDSYVGEESTVYGASVHCYNHRTGVLNNTPWKMGLHPGPQRLAMAVGEDGNVLAMRGYGTLIKFSPECVMVQHQPELGPPVIPSEAYKANWRAYQTWGVPLIVEDRVLLVSAFNRLVEFDYESLEILREISLPVGHASLPIFVTPRGETVLHGGMSGLTILAPDLSVALSWIAFVAPGYGPSVALADGAFVNIYGGEIVVRRVPDRWVRHGAFPSVGYDDAATPTVSSDGEIWALGVGIGNTEGTKPVSTGPLAKVGRVIAGFREGVDASGKAVALATRRTFLGDGENVHHTFPAMPRDEQVIYVTKKGVHSRKLEGLRMPNPTHWSTAHGNMARDRRWRRPSPGSVPEPPARRASAEP